MKLTLNPSFDPDEALSIVEGDRDLFLELVHVFRENYPTELSSIRDAIGLRDSEALWRASHHFKGTLSALAAGPACDAAVRLEDIGRNADLTEPRPPIPRWSNTFRRLTRHYRNGSTDLL
jgi:two-component system sensor histidine kinase/response regulator